MFHIIMKIGGRSCKIAVNSESCINDVSSTIIAKIGLKAVPHPHPFRVTWINSSALEVKQRCLVPIDFDLYKDNIWYDVVSMDVGHVILGRTWLYDKDVTIYGRSNMCQFEHEGKKIKLLPRELKAEPSKPKPTTVKNTNNISLMTAKAFNQNLEKVAPFVILATKKITKEPTPRSLLKLHQ